MIVKARLFVSRINRTAWGLALASAAGLQVARAQGAPDTGSDLEQGSGLVPGLLIGLPQLGLLLLVVFAVLFALFWAILLRIRTSHAKAHLVQKQKALEAAELALRQSEAKYRRLLDVAAEGILTIDLSGIITFANPRMRTMLGIDGEDLIGRSLYEFVSEEFRAQVQLHVEECRDEVREYEELTLLRSDGSQFWASIAATVVHAETGEAVGLLGMFSDITERKHTEAALLESEAKYRHLYELESDSIFLIENEGGRILEVNPAACALYGYTREEMLTRHNYDMSAEPDDTRAATSQRRPTIPIRYHKKKDGTVFPVEITASFLTWKGQPVHIAAIRDISARLAAQREIEEQRGFLRKVLDNVPAAIVVKDVNGRIVMANQAMAAQLGSSVDELLGKTKAELGMAAARLQESETEEQAIIEGKTGYPAREESFIDADGRQRWVHRAKLGMRNAEGEVTHVIGVYTDLTSAIEIEEERTRLATAIEQAAEAIVVTDTHGTILYVNPAFSRVTGYSREEAVGRNPNVLKSGVHEDAFYGRMWATIAAGDVWSGRFTNRRKDGTLYEEEATISPVRDRSGAIVNYVAVKRDVTNEAELERRLRQAEKMEAIGTLAGGIAHDFNNILAIILGFTELMKQVSADPAVLRSNLDQVHQAAQRGKDLVGQILTFSRRVDMKPVPVNVAAAIEEAFRLLRPSIPATIAIVQEIEPTSATVLAAPAHVHQLIVNLCTNAYQAMDETGGTLLVRLSQVQLDKHDLPGNVQLKPGAYLKLMVSDTGPGMDESTRERVFEPFFTTKVDGKGTGLGLAVVHGIVAELKGEISVQSAMGAGTTFCVHLPCHSARPKQKATGQAPIERGQGERLWLVDDEPALLDANRQLFERLGYRVMTFENPAEALERFTADPSQVDLLITDQTMPRLTGIELAERILAIRDNLPVVLATGFSAQVSREEVLRRGVREFVLKPFVFRDLSGIVRRLLDTANTPPA